MLPFHYSTALIYYTIPVPGTYLININDWFLSFSTKLACKNVHGFQWKRFLIDWSDPYNFKFTYGTTVNQTRNVKIKKTCSDSNLPVDLRLQKFNSGGIFLPCKHWQGNKRILKFLLFSFLLSLVFIPAGKLFDPGVVVFFTRMVAELVCRSLFYMVFPMGNF